LRYFDNGNLALSLAQVLSIVCVLLLLKYRNVSQTWIKVWWYPRAMARNLIVSPIEFKILAFPLNFLTWFYLCHLWSDCFIRMQSLSICGSQLLSIAFQIWHDASNFGRNLWLTIQGLELFGVLKHHCFWNILVQNFTKI
jgi:hypothetical protein